MAMGRRIWRCTEMGLVDFAVLRWRWGVNNYGEERHRISLCRETTMAMGRRIRRCTEMGPVAAWIMRLSSVPRMAVIITMGRSSPGYPCAGRLRWGWEDGCGGVSRWSSGGLCVPPMVRGLQYNGAGSDRISHLIANNSQSHGVIAIGRTQCDGYCFLFLVAMAVLVALRWARNIQRQRRSSGL